MFATSEQTVSPAAYQFIVNLVYQHSRIRLGNDKQALVSGRLAKRLRALGLDTYEAYCELLKSPAGHEELSSLVDVISTNHTHFFREVEHLNYLRDHILPEFMPQVVQARTPFRLWSAASSSGEEPYTLAIVIAEFVRTRGAMEWQIEGSDISHKVLAKARDAIYEADRVQVPHQDMLHRYFQQGTGEHDGLYRVKDQLRRQVKFHQLNLLQAAYPIPAGQHVIFCRNVMIYFDAATQQELVTKLIAHLVPGGYLIVGASESLLGVKHNLKPVHPAIYRKP
jgi:chemotaxis protein methyltransferase CheR